jgi:hypothetical protein
MDNQLIDNVSNSQHFGKIDDNNHFYPQVKNIGAKQKENETHSRAAGVVIYQELDMDFF